MQACCKLSVVCDNETDIDIRTYADSGGSHCVVNASSFHLHVHIVFHHNLHRTAARRLLGFSHDFGTSRGSARVISAVNGGRVATTDPEELDLFGAVWLLTS